MLYDQKECVWNFIITWSHKKKKRSWSCGLCLFNSLFRFSGCNEFFISSYFNREIQWNACVKSHAIIWLAICCKQTNFASVKFQLNIRFELNQQRFPAYYFCLYKSIHFTAILPSTCWREGRGKKYTSYENIIFPNNHNQHCIEF